MPKALEKLVKKLKKKRGVKKPWGLAKWILKRKKKRK